jgi:hypothetical protein
VYDQDDISAGLKDDFTLKHLARIIERDSKDSTYKFALLRGTIDIIQKYPHFMEAVETRVRYPMGLLLLKWIEYYYPLLSHDSFIPQKYGDDGKRTIAFRKEFDEVIGLYPNTSTFHSLEYDLKRGITDPDRLRIVLGLLRKLRDTIVRQPMHYIGSAIGRGGQIYGYAGGGVRIFSRLDLDRIIHGFGSFSIPADFYHVLQVVGAFVSGTHSIIFKWAEFTSGISRDLDFRTSDIIGLLSDQESVRDVEQARRFFKNILESEGLNCIWSGIKIAGDMHVDHVLPFSALGNNDLWNLLPVREAMNARKRDAIPAPGLLGADPVKERIIGTWERLVRSYPQQFFREIGIALLGRRKIDPSNWQNTCYHGLTDMSSYLINQRGLMPWKYSAG